MWMIFVGVLSSWLVVAVAAGFAVARAIRLRDTRTPAPPAPLQVPEHVHVLAA